MNRLILLLTGVVVLAILRAAVAGLLIALAVILLAAFVTRPRETLLFLGTIALTGLASAQPIACIIVLGIITLAVVVAAQRCGSRASHHRVRKFKRLRH